VNKSARDNGLLQKASARSELYRAIARRLTSRDVSASLPINPATAITKILTESDPSCSEMTRLKSRQKRDILRNLPKPEMRSDHVNNGSTFGNLFV
jgi:hypothetical protein